MPELTAAQREQGQQPQRRRRWRCPTCGEIGWAQNAHAAYLAGTRHYEQAHDPKEPTP